MCYRLLGLLVACDRYWITEHQGLDYTNMITGYNTDVEHDGVVYHVQTEDKGLESPIVLSLVYSGGAILAAKRSAYDDLIAAGFQEAKLAERLKRQHRLICAAIHAGRIEELRKLSKPQPGRPGADVVEPKAIPEMVPPEPLAQQPNKSAKRIPSGRDRIGEPAAPPSAVPANAMLVSPMEGQPTAPAASNSGSALPAAGDLAPQTGSSPYTVHDPRGRSRMGEVALQPDGLRITLLGHDPDFHGGENIQLQAIVTRISNQVEGPLNGASISVKILGTTFRPVLLSLKTDREGLMSVWTRIPSFTSGRAAIVVKAMDHDLSAEARWVVHPGK